MHSPKRVTRPPVMLCWMRLAKLVHPIQQWWIDWTSLSNVNWIYEWTTTFSTFDPMVSWLHFWESVVNGFNNWHWWFLIIEWVSYSWVDCELYISVMERYFYVPSSAHVWFRQIQPSGKYRQDSTFSLALWWDLSLHLWRKCLNSHFTLVEILNLN